MAENNRQQNQALFITLIQQYQMQAWISLGKLKNPVTDKLEKNLDLAKMSIDMLSMLKEKTHGNVNEDESRLLDQTLNDLKLSYVEVTKNKDQDDDKEHEQEKNSDNRSGQDPQNK